MSRASALSHPVATQGHEQARAEPAANTSWDSPWLVFAAPVSFVLTLIVACWISLNSF